jgi:plasmid stability protein
MAATTITIRHVPEDVRNVLAARAARGGRSLQEFMLNEVIRLASKPTTEELIAEVRERKRRTARHVGRKAILADRDADRR